MLFIVVYVAAVVYLALKKARGGEGVFRSQARNIGLGVLCSLLIGIFTQALRPVLGFRIPESSVLSTLIFVSFIAYAINKYGMLTITTKVVAGNIIATMNDFVLAVDKNMRVALVNEAVIKNLRYNEKDLLNKPIYALLVSRGEPMQYERLLKQAPISDMKINLITNSGEKIPVSANISVLREGGNEALGLVFVMRDTREIDELVKNLQEKKTELEAKNVELEQFNNMAVGREMKMMELKNKIKALEASQGK